MNCDFIENGLFLPFTEERLFLPLDMCLSVRTFAIFSISVHRFISTRQTEIVTSEVKTASTLLQKTF